MVQDNILEYLDRNSLAILSLTCHRLHRLARKYLYRELKHYLKYHALIKRNVRADPTLIPYIHSFTSYEPSFLKWMWTQMVQSLEKLDLQGPCTVENAYSEILESIHQSRVKELTFGLMPTLEFCNLSSRGVFSGLTFLHLRIGRKSEYTLQTILDQLHAPALEILEVDNISDWRIQWPESFEEAIPNLRGLRLHMSGWEDDVMFDSPPPDLDSEQRIPPSSVMWNTALTLYRRYIFFDIFYCDPVCPFLDYAPSYASAHQLDPVPLVQWLIKSFQFFSGKDGGKYIHMKVGDVPLTDLSTILSSMKSMDFGRFEMIISLDLPHGTPTSIADLLPHNIYDLSIRPPFEGFLDPSVVPECIRSLPNLEHVNISLNVWWPDFELRNGCTAASCSFRTIPRHLTAYLEVIRGSKTAWYENLCDRQHTIDKHDLGDVADFEMEVKEWFQLSASLKSVVFDFHERVDDWDWS